MGICRWVGGGRQSGGWMGEVGGWMSGAGGR